MAKLLGRLPSGEIRGNSSKFMVYEEKKSVRSGRIFFWLRVLVETTVLRTKGRRGC